MHSGRLTWLYKIQLRTGLLAPKEHCFTGEFGAVIASDARRLSRHSMMRSRSEQPERH